MNTSIYFPLKIMLFSSNSQGLFATMIISQVINYSTAGVPVILLQPTVLSVNVVRKTERWAAVTLFPLWSLRGYFYISVMLNCITIRKILVLQEDNSDILSTSDKDDKTSQNTTGQRPKPHHLKSKPVFRKGIVCSTTKTGCVCYCQSVSIFYLCFVGSVIYSMIHTLIQFYLCSLSEEAFCLRNRLA